ncbi:MAG: copper amine oxidase N-terminal domain-containing protein [Defluviitaleaceae bacterium]|nr:copper amine oxidase N-terminal domain-containing protein [Defluviitaleaceae bacterium]
MKKFLLFSLLLLFIFIPRNNVVAQMLNSTNNQTVILNGRIFNSNSPLIIINSRLMVPFREFAEAMGATVNWYGGNQRITIFRDNLYSILHINNAVVQHGEFVNIGGDINFITQTNTVMDSPATLVNNLTYIPLRAVAESLGATVDWDSTTSTATITTLSSTTSITNNVPAGTNTTNTNNTNVNTADLPSNYGNFTNINYFSIISSRQAQARFNDSHNYPFVLVVYDSTDTHSKRIVPSIQNAASNVQYRIFGLDKSVPENVGIENNWIFNIINRNAFTYPAILYVFSPTNIALTLRDSINLSNIEQELRIFRTLSETGYTFGDLSSTNFFTNITSSSLEQRHRNSEEFVVLLYDSNNPDANFEVPQIKAAARLENFRIFAVDIDVNPQYISHLNFLPDIATSLSHRMPMMFLVYNANNINNNNNNTTVHDRITTVSYARRLISEFRNRSIGNTNQNNQNQIQNRELDNHNNFTHTSSSNIQNRINSRENFVVLVYDSRNTVNLNNANQIRNAAINSNFIHVVNIGSTIFNNTNDLSWFTNSIGSTSLNNIQPTLIHFNNGFAVRHQIFTDQNILNNATNFITSSIGNGQNNIQNQTGDLPNHLNFSHTSASHIVSRVNARENFVVLAYDSRNNISRQIASQIRDAAISTNVISVVNVGTTNVTHNINDLWWLRQVLNVTDTNNIQPVLVHFNNGNIVTHSHFTNQNNVVGTANSFISIALGWAPVTNTPNLPNQNIGDLSGHSNFVNTSAANIASRINARENFVVLAFDSRNPLSRQNADIIRTASANANIIQVVNIGSTNIINTHNDLWWLRNAINLTNIDNISPILLHFNNGALVSHESFTGTNQSVTLTNATNFITIAIGWSNSIIWPGDQRPPSGPTGPNVGTNNQNNLGDLQAHANFTQTSALNITNRIRNNENFVVLVYNSGNNNARITANYIREAATITNHIFAVNLHNSSNFSYTNDDLAWLSLAVGSANIHSIPPTLIHFRNNQLINTRSFQVNIDNAMTIRDASTFIRNAF